MRPSLVDPSWRLAVFTFGLVTAAIGPKAAMACTIAVEEVTGKNYQKQADILGEDELDLHAINERFHDEELNIAISSLTMMGVKRKIMN